MCFPPGNLLTASQAGGRQAVLVARRVLHFSSLFLPNSGVYHAFVSFVVFVCPACLWLMNDMRVGCRLAWSAWTVSCTCMREVLPCSHGLPYNYERRDAKCGSANFVIFPALKFFLGTFELRIREEFVQSAIKTYSPMENSTSTPAGNFVEQPKVNSPVSANFTRQFLNR